MAPFGAQSPVVEAPGTTPGDRLDSWKEIASYLDRGVRTVQRWEREEGLPVHRLQHEKRGTVYAYRRELDEWWKGRGARLSAAEHTEANLREDRGPGFLRQVPLVLAAAAVIVLGLIGTATWLWQQPDVQPLTLQRVTTSDSRLLHATLSPDGRLVAYLSDGGRESAPLQVWVQQVGSPTGIQITHEDAEAVTFPTFSPDSTRVLYTRGSRQRRDVYEISALGGTPRLLLANARRARYSPDGRWLAYLGMDSHLYVKSADTGETRKLTRGLTGGRAPAWAPDSRRLLVGARRDAATEPDLWIVPVDGGAPIETELAQTLRKRGFDPGWLSVSLVWATDDEIVFSGRNQDGWSIWRQRLNRSTWKADGEPERLTTGTTVEWWPSVAGNKLAYISSHVDRNIWMVPADTNAGTVTGTLRRVTRGPGATTYPSLSRDGRVLAFASERSGNWDIYVKDLTSGKEVVLAGGPERQMYAALSEDGLNVAFGVVTSDAEVTRPAYVTTVADGRVQKLCDDCNGRPAVWAQDGRNLLLERFGGPRVSVAVMNTETGAQVDLLRSEQHSVSRPRVSSDGQWIAFEVSRPGSGPAAFVARMEGLNPIPSSKWVQIDRDALMPAWSPDGRLLYFVAGISSQSHTIRARRFDPVTGHPAGESFDVLPLEERIVTQFLNRGVALIAAPDRIFITLASFTGDVWVTTLAAKSRGASTSS
jgi:Tol biopolymer transport system component